MLSGAAVWWRNEQGSYTHVFLNDIMKNEPCRAFYIATRANSFAERNKFKLLHGTLALTHMHISSMDKIGTRETAQFITLKHHMNVTLRSGHIVCEVRFCTHLNILEYTCGRYRFNNIADANCVPNWGDVSARCVQSRVVAVQHFVAKCENGIPPHELTIIETDCIWRRANNLIRRVRSGRYAGNRNA